MQGQGKSNPVIEGNKSEKDEIVVKAENITIQGFTVYNFRTEGKRY